MNGSMCSQESQRANTLVSTMPLETDTKVRFVGLFDPSPGLNRVVNCYREGRERTETLAAS